MNPEKKSNKKKKTERYPAAIIKLEGN